MGHQRTKMFRYEQVFYELKEKISNNEYAEGAYLPSEHEIGILYDVDRSTVRRALQMLVEQGLVEKQAGKGSRVAAKENAKSLLESKVDNKQIAFLLPKGTHNNDRITQPFYSEIFYTIEADCQKKGFSTIYSTLNTKEDFQQFLRSSECDGIIFVSNIAEDILDMAIERKIPSVLVNSTYERMVSVISDGFNGTYAACKHLIEYGHRNIGVIKGVEAYCTTKDRLNGCIVALHEAGLELKPEYILQGDWDYESGYEAVKNMLNSGTDYPTALIAFNDHLAMGAMYAIVEAGLSVPADISVVGFDNMKEAGYSIPGLTTVHSQAQIVSHVAAQALFRQLEGDVLYPTKIITPVHLVKRSSVSCRK
jgi:LacI family transcriptional regulator